MNEPAALSKRIFFVCLLFFMSLAAYGIYYSEIRMQFEAAEDTILTCLGQFRIPYYRFAYILNKVLFLLALKLHLPFKAVTVLYSVNDALFYIGVAFLIIWLTRRYDYAAAALAAPVLIHDSVFYYIANELFLSGTMMLLFAAVHQSMSSGRLKTLVLAASIFFVVWSHPLTLVILLIFLPLLYHSISDVKSDWKIALFILLNLALRLALFSNYDRYKVSQMSGSWFDMHFWLNTAVRYLDEYPYLIIAALLAAIAFFRAKQKVMYSGLLLVPFLVACCSASGIQVGQPYFIKFMYPVQLLWLLLALLFIHRLPPRPGRWAPLVVAALMFFSLQHLIERNHRIIYNRTVVTQRLNAVCRLQDSTWSKWYIRQTVLDMPLLFSGDECHESLFYSEYQGLPLNVQLAQVREDELGKIDSIKEEMLFANMNIEYPISRLDTCYFRMRTGCYKELVFDSAARHYLTAGLQ